MGLSNHTRTMNKRILFCVIVVLLITSSLSSCVLKDDFAENLITKINVFPSQEYFEEFTSVARIWQADAYLVEVFITFSKNRNNYIEFVYESQNKIVSAYSIRTYKDGAVEKESILKNDISENNQIFKNEWKLDSPEALYIAFSDKRTKEFFGESTEDVCGFMVLEKTGLSDHPLVWRIYIDNCKDLTTFVKIKVDATTSEVID